MAINRADVDDYLQNGCGRCDKHSTPACKVHRFPEELRALRALVRASGLDEQLKWGSPCYTLEGVNVVMLTALRDHASLGFFQGAALVDEAGVLQSPGPSSRYVRVVRFRSMQEVRARTAAVRALLAQAIALARSGARVEPAGELEPVPAELARRLAADPALRRAFEALTPGRRRSHVLHVAGAKQAETRERRVDRCAQDILAGRGFHER